jgi:hypothetical protein
MLREAGQVHFLSKIVFKKEKRKNANLMGLLPSFPFKSCEYDRIIDNCPRMPEQYLRPQPDLQIFLDFSSCFDLSKIGWSL